MSKQPRNRTSSPVLKKLAIEIRYEPNLRVYDRMDLVGITLRADFPDWERSPLALEIRNHTKHRRLAITHRMSLFDSIAPKDEEAEFALAKNAVQITCQKIDTVKLQRFGMRCWFMAKADADFDSLVERVYRRFFVPTSHLAPFGDMQVKDVGYTVDFSAEGWTYGVRLGPMEKEQWLTAVYHERKVFEPEPDSETFAKYTATLPQRFIYIDVDAWKEDIPYDVALDYVRRLRRRTNDIVHTLLKCVEE